jgi:hypothetical protein
MKASKFTEAQIAFVLRQAEVSRSCVVRGFWGKLDSRSVPCHTGRSGKSGSTGDGGSTDVS